MSLSLHLSFSICLSVYRSLSLSLSLSICLNLYRSIYLSINLTSRSLSLISVYIGVSIQACLCVSMSVCFFYVCLCALQYDLMVVRMSRMQLLYRKQHSRFFAMIVSKPGASKFRKIRIVRRRILHKDYSTYC